MQEMAAAREERLRQELGGVSEVGAGTRACHGSSTAAGRGVLDRPPPHLTCRCLALPRTAALQALVARTQQLTDLESKLASETVCTAKYRRMVGEIGKLIDWAQNTSPLPPTLGGRTSPAGYASMLGGRCAGRGAG